MGEIHYPLPWAVLKPYQATQCLHSLLRTICNGIPRGTLIRHDYALLAFTIITIKRSNVINL